MRPPGSGAWEALANGAVAVGAAEDVGDGDAPGDGDAVGRAAPEQADSARVAINMAASCRRI